MPCLCFALPRINQLERELKNQEKVKIDLAKRVKMLEVLSIFLLILFN
jgi:hypothetical protein